MAMTDRRGSGGILPGDARSAWGVDFSRVVHSSSFRRLQGKTQILSVGDGDFHRTRLTHSLETAQIAEGLVERLARDTGADPNLPTSQLIRTVSLCHDLGHPPFGHSGEVALNRCMMADGGFEGNGQTLRIASKLEHYSDGYGFDLTRRALLGVVKYPVLYSKALDGGDTAPTTAKPPKCLLDTEADTLDWLLKDFSSADAALYLQLQKVPNGWRPLHVTLDCAIMEIADDVAYGVHDLEDAVALGLITRENFQNFIGNDCLEPFIDWMIKSGAWPSAEYSTFVADLFGGERQRKRSVGRLVHYLIASAKMVCITDFEHPLLSQRVDISPESRHLLDSLQSLVAQEVILRSSVQQLEYKGRRAVEAVFDAYASDPFRLLPEGTRRLFEKADHPRRVVCDHIAAMTDDALIKTYERLFVVRSGSPFDLL